MSQFKRMVLIPENEYLNLKKTNESMLGKKVIKENPSEMSDKSKFETIETLNNRLNEENRHAASNLDTSQVENDDGLELLLNETNKFFNSKDIPKGTLLIKRLFHTGNLRVNASDKKVMLGDHSIPFLAFIDFIHLCISRKRPENSDNLRQFAIFLHSNDIPLNLIANPYIKNLARDNESLNSESFSEDFPESSILEHSDPISKKAVRKKGSRAMEPKRKPVTWFRSLQDVSIL